MFSRMDQYSLGCFSLEKDMQMFCPTRNLTEWTYYSHYVVLYMSKKCVLVTLRKPMNM